MASGRIPSKQLGFAGGAVPSLVEYDVDCELAVYVGAAVYMDISIAKNGIANDANKVKIVGICINKPTTVKCDILIGGVSSDLYAGLDDKKYLFLSPTVAGAMQQTPPVIAGEYVVNIGQPFTDKRIKVNVMQAMLRT